MVRPGLVVTNKILCQKSECTNVFLSQWFYMSDLIHAVQNALKLQEITMIMYINSRFNQEIQLSSQCTVRSGQVVTF